MPTPAHHITICGVDELRKHREAGVDHLLTILSPQEYETHREAWAGFFGVNHQAVLFDDVVMPRPGACTPEHIQTLLAFGERVHREPDSHLLVHCHAGVSRSTAVAAVLMCQHAPGREREAFMRLAKIRPQAVPNQHVLDLADQALGRNGALLDALDHWLEREAQ